MLYVMDVTPMPMFKMSHAVSKALFSTAFCPNTPPTCALNRALVFAPLVPFRLPPAAPTTEAIAPVCALISSLMCSGNRLRFLN